MSKTRTATAFSAIISILVLTPSLAAAQICGAPVQKRLADLSIAQEDVEKVTVVARKSGGQNFQRILGYDAWVKLKSCPSGSLVLSMTKTCRDLGPYTTGSCRVPGVGG